MSKTERVPEANDQASEGGTRVGGRRDGGAVGVAMQARDAAAAAKGTAKTKATAKQSCEPPPTVSTHMVAPTAE